MLEPKMQWIYPEHVKVLVCASILRLATSGRRKKRVSFWAREAFCIPDWEWVGPWIEAFGQVGLFPVGLVAIVIPLRFV